GNKRDRKHRLILIQAKQRAIRRIADRVIPHAAERKTPDAENKQVLIAYGNGKFETSSRSGLTTTPLACIPKYLGMLKNVVTILTKEFRTSKLCPSCHSPLEQKILKWWERKWKHYDLVKKRIRWQSQITKPGYNF